MLYAAMSNSHDTWLDFLFLFFIIQLLQIARGIEFGFSSKKD